MGQADILQDFICRNRCYSLTYDTVIIWWLHALSVLLPIEVSCVVYSVLLAAVIFMQLVYYIM